MEVCINSSLKLVTTKGYGVQVTMIGRSNAVKHFCFNAVRLGTFHLTDDQNTHDQIMQGRKSKHAQSNCVLCIPFILSGSPNECCLHRCDVCIITTWRLGLWAPLVARNNFMLMEQEKFKTVPDFLSTAL